jgi:nitrite reductase/ring-hydroxylating ferredoxin subunit
VSGAAADLRLCALDDLASPGSARFDLDLGPGNHGLCVVRQGADVYGYLNCCPHTGAPMDWVHGQFLDVTETRIQCSLHGAQFRIHDGYCVYGPCAGASLTAVPLSRRGKDIFLEAK